MLCFNADFCASHSAKIADGRRAGLNPGPGLKPVLAVDNDLVAGVQAALHDRRPVIHLPDADWLHRDGRIRFDHIDVHAVGPTLDRCRGHGDDLLQRTQQQPYIDKLAWPERVIFVLKSRLQAD